MADESPLPTVFMDATGILSEQGFTPWADVRFRSASTPAPSPDLRFMRPEVNSTEVAFEINLKTGEVTLGEGMEPDDAARVFWDAVRRLAPGHLPAT